MRTFFLSYWLFLVLFASISFSQGFLKAEGKNIVNEQGDEIILRGMGLGGWMLQEPYMMQTSSFTSAQHELKEKIEELAGTEGMEEFYDAWLSNHCRKADIDSMAAWGFNSVRLPMHYNLYTLPIEDEPVAGENTWLQKGFELTDRLLEWCADNEMYLILDLHAAPGGQGEDKPISDYDDSKPSLWESEENRAKTVALWRKLAERYKDEPWIGGYDLINETNWDLPGNTLLKNLYVDITEAIREVDTRHIIFIEGNWFANDFTGLTPPWDDNMVYSFHKYWSYNDQNSIQWVLNIRNSFNVPIWCGEAGENSNVWFRNAIWLLELNNIGWAWWPLKKVESVTGPLSITKNSGYQTLIEYWEGNAARPSQEFARLALLQLAENSKIENCVFQRDVIDAMFRQVNTSETIPFKKHNLPGIIPAAEFDLGRHKAAYFDSDVANYHVSSGEWTAWNTGGAFRNDGVDIEPAEDPGGSPFSVGWIEEGEWLTFTAYISHSGSYDVVFRVASPDGQGRITLELDDQSLITGLDVPETGGWYNWQEVTVSDIELPAGERTFKVLFPEAGFNFNQMEFVSDSNGLGNSGSGLPDEFYLGQNYPNPFNSRTVIPLKIPEDSGAEIVIFDHLGKQIKRLSPEGKRSVVWNGLNEQNVPSGSGIFYYRLKTENDSKTRKMLLLN